MNTVMIWQTVTINSAETERLGQLLGSLIQPPQVVELVSDLGGGKTTFVRGLVRGFGSRDTVSSPTFTLNKIYKAKGNTEIYHFDFYRLDDPGVVADQLAESLQNKNVVTVVEWSNIVKNVLPKDRITVEFKSVETSSEERQVTIKYPEAQAGVIRKLETLHQGLWS